MADSNGRVTAAKKIAREDVFIVRLNYYYFAFALIFRFVFLTIDCWFEFDEML